MGDEPVSLEDDDLSEAIVHDRIPVRVLDLIAQFGPIGQDRTRAFLESMQDNGSDTIGVVPRLIIADAGYPHLSDDNLTVVLIETDGTRVVIHDGETSSSGSDSLLPSLEFDPPIAGGLVYDLSLVGNIRFTWDGTHIPVMFMPSDQVPNRGRQASESESDDSPTLSQQNNESESNDSSTLYRQENESESNEDSSLSGLSNEDSSLPDLSFSLIDNNMQNTTIATEPSTGSDASSSNSSSTQS